MFGITNWQTTLGGLSTVLAALGAATHALSMRDFNAALMSVPAVLAGFALMAAKDHNVTGGTVPQTTEAKVRVEAPEVITQATTPMFRPTPPSRPRA